MQKEKKLIEQNKKGKLDWTYKPKYMNISKSMIPLEHFNKRSETNEGKDKEDFLAKKIFYDNLLTKDNTNINNNISDYKEYLRDIEKNKDNKINKIINNGNSFGHNFSFKLKDVKLLSYKEEKKEDIKVKKKENQEIDIVKLLRYTKRGNRKWFENNLRQRSKNRINSFKNNFKKKKTLFSSSSAVNLRRKKLLNKPNEDNYNKNYEETYNENNMLGATSSTTFSNFKNTIKTVKNEAEMMKYINQNFDIKRNTMEGFFKRSALPKLEEYEIMFKTRNNFRNMNKKNNFDQDQNNINYNRKNSSNGGNKKNLKDELINMDILKDFQKTYNLKKLKWAEEDKEKERIKKKEQEIIEETKKYLKEIKQVKRQAHLYVDPYSKRDELINNRIKLFTRSLNGHFYSQGKMQNKLDDFNNYIETKEYEKKKNDEILSRTMKEEERKRREEDDVYKLLEKIRRNLEIENMNKKEVGDIRKNYKFISTLKMCKNEDQDQPYKEYKEIYEIIKDKNRRREVENNYI